jgi:hypothetical protein
MSTWVVGNTIYTHPMAKVMISIPDALLERVDATVRASGETRSGFLQRLAERELQQADHGRRGEIERLLDQIRSLDPGDNADVDAAQMIREDRDAR